MTRSFFKRRPITALYLFFLYFSGTFQLLLYSTGSTGSVGLRQTLLLSVLGIIPVLLWPSKIKTITAILGIAMLTGALVNLGYWLIYAQEFSQSTIFIIFESNMNESSEFIRSYLRWWQPILLLIFTIPPILMWRKIQPFKLDKIYRYKLAVLFTIIFLWPLINTSTIKMAGIKQGLYHQAVRMEPVAPWNLIIGYVKYQQQLKAMEAILKKNKSLSPIKNLAEKNPLTNKTLVLVIGESTNRQRMSLYGYQRNTTPKLDAIKKELTVFNDVITPRPYTIEALQQILSFADSKNIDAFFNQPTLINLMQQAGYEVTWITNQQTQTKRNTMLTTLSQMADKQVYLNNNRNQNSKQYDDVVIKPFNDAINFDAPKKMIIVHLLGTHRKYNYRYPEKFEKFNNRENSPSWLSSDLLDEYNSYDNAILYNDYIISLLINTLKNHASNSLLVYLSDHGEEVFDTAENLFTGRNEMKPLPAMYTVPFIIWTSQKYRVLNNTDNWKNYTDRPYSSADFIYTWADLAGINFPKMDHSRSLISKNFRNKPRWIGDPSQPKSLRDYPF